MKEDIALRVLSEIMQWDNERARNEFSWLSLMSRLKYDTYRDFLAGVRFIESLADWLQQFPPGERETAYAFLRHQLIYFGPGEMQHLVEVTYHEVIRKRLMNAAAHELGIPQYRLGMEKEGLTRFRALLRRSLFLGLSDGARIDSFRRMNAGIISNEQIVPHNLLDNAKWASLLEELNKDTGDPLARFQFVFLIDDFVGSGKTLLRKKAGGAWEGKLAKFCKHIAPLRASHFAQTITICVHHYVSSHEAKRLLEYDADEATQAVLLVGDVLTFTFGTVLPADAPVTEKTNPGFMKLIRKYYNSSIETKHTKVGDTADVRLGFGGCALPLVLEHNTPNNSIALLWADTTDDNGQHAMRPLFRRRQRHV